MTTLDVDVLHPTVQQEARTCKKKTLVPNPRSGFLSLRCPGCTGCTTAFSHSNSVVICEDCGAAIAFPTGGRIRLGENVEARARISA